MTARHALRNISFEIAEGEILGIIGRTAPARPFLSTYAGGGTAAHKWQDYLPCVGLSLLRLYGRGKPQPGKPCPHCGGILAALDVDLWNETNEMLKRRVMRRTAIMFQRTFALYGDDRVIENVLHALDDIDYPPEKAINRAADLIDQVRLSHRMMHIARDLSGGEKQRVVLARRWQKSRSCFLPMNRPARWIPGPQRSSTQCLPRRQRPITWAWW